ncbi:MAG: hypothetical protein R3F30_03190 [Planctomycetota bacterium]
MSLPASPRPRAPGRPDRPDDADLRHAQGRRETEQDLRLLPRLRRLDSQGSTASRRSTRWRATRPPTCRSRQQGPGRQPPPQQLLQRPDLRQHDGPVDPHVDRRQRPHELELDLRQQPRDQQDPGLRLGQQHQTPQLAGRPTSTTASSRCPSTSDPLDTLFVLVQSAGKSVCIDYYITKRIHTYTSGSNTYHQFIILDGDGQATGDRVNNGGSWSNCKFSDGKYNSGIGYTTGGLTDAGGTWYLSYSNVPSNTAGVATLSGFGVNNLPHAWPLPISLAPLGSPTCDWRVGLELGVFVPLNSGSNTYARWPNITIPPGLGGNSFFDHALFLDKPTSTNKYGLVTSWSSEWQIAKSYTPACATVWKYQDTTPPATSGTLYRNRAAIIEVVY